MKDKIRIAFDELLHEKNAAANVVLETVSLLLVGVVIFVQALVHYNEYKTNEILHYGVERTGLIIIDNSEPEVMPEFLKQISKVDGMAQLGSATTGYFDKNDYENQVFDEIYEIQKDHRDITSGFTEGFLGQVIETVTIANGSETLFDFKVKKGYSFDECEQFLGDYYQVIYLGSKIANMDIGTVVEDKYGRKSLVVGYLESGLKMVKEDIGDEMVAYTDMDYKLLCVSGGEVDEYGLMYFGIDKGVDMYQFKQDIYQAARDNAVEIHIKTFDGIFQDIESNNQVYIEFLKQILAIVLVTVVILQVCMQTVHIIDNFKNYGVMYANGFATIDYMVIFAVQSLIKGIVAIFLALAGGYIILDVFFASNVYHMDVLYEVALKFVLWKVVVCAVVIAVLTAGCAYGFFAKRTPKELINER